MVEETSNISTEFLLLLHPNNFDNITGLVVVALLIYHEEKDILHEKYAQGAYIGCLD